MARWSDVIYLIGGVDGYNEVGDPIVGDGPPRMVYANKRSIRQSEFYQAMQAGLKPEIMFEVWSAEFRGEGKLRWQDDDYTIIRSYDKGEVTELICSGLVGEA